MRVATIIACHNRKGKTVACLVNLHAQASVSGRQLDVYLLDDGSTDGTAAEVSARFPSVRIIQGDGSYYWCGGMRKAWSVAAKGDYDAYLWLNDDTFLYPWALNSLIETMARQRSSTGCDGIVFGSTRDPSNGRPTFGAFTFRGVMDPPNEPAPARCFNGNLVLVSRAAFQRLGNLSSAYRHSFGDIDYGLRAERAGVPSWVAAGFLADCSPTPRPDWDNPDVPLRHRFRSLHGPKGCPPGELAHFGRLSVGWAWPILIVRLYLRVLWPRWPLIG